MVSLTEEVTYGAGPGGRVRTVRTSRSPGVASMCAVHETRRSNVAQTARAGQPAWNRQLWRLAAQDLSPTTIAIFARELGLDDARDDQRCRPALEDFGDVLADPVKRIEPRTLDLVGQDLDVDARKVFGNRLSAGRLAPSVAAHGLLDLELAQVGFAVLSEHHRQHFEGKLRLVGQPLRLLATQP